MRHGAGTSRCETSLRSAALQSRSYCRVSSRLLWISALPGLKKERVVDSFAPASDSPIPFSSTPYEFSTNGSAGPYRNAAGKMASAVPISCGSNAASPGSAADRHLPAGRLPPCYERDASSVRPARGGAGQQPDQAAVERSEGKARLLSQYRQRLTQIARAKQDQGDMVIACLIVGPVVTTAWRKASRCPCPRRGGPLPRLCQEASGTADRSEGADRLPRRLRRCPPFVQLIALVYQPSRPPPDRPTAGSDSTGSRVSRPGADWSERGETEPGGCV